MTAHRELLRTHRQDFPRVTTRRSGQKVFQKPAGRVGSDQKVFEKNAGRVGSGRGSASVGLGGFQISRGRAGSPWPDSTGVVWYTEKRSDR